MPPQRRLAVEGRFVDHLVFPEPNRAFHEVEGQSADGNVAQNLAKHRILAGKVDDLHRWQLALGPGSFHRFSLVEFGKGDAAVQDALDALLQHRDLTVRQHPGSQQVSVGLEEVNLFLGEVHGFSLKCNILASRHPVPRLAHDLQKTLRTGGIDQTF